MTEPVPKDPRPDAYTRTGRPIWYWNPERTPVDHDEVVTVLSEQYRYAGQFPVSVLLHSWIVAEIALILGGEPDVVGYAGVHDCHEAYCQDLPRGLKALLRDYAVIEEGWQDHVLAAFGFAPPSTKITLDVWRADRIAVAVELRLVGLEDEHPMFQAALRDIGDVALLERVYVAVEEVAARMPQLRGAPDPRAVLARWQSLTCPHLPPLRLLNASTWDRTPTLAANVIDRLKAALDVWSLSYPDGPAGLRATGGDHVR